MNRRRRNRTTFLVLSGVVFGMVGLSYAAVPLYRLFCQITGYGGTTQVAETAPEAVVDRVITVRFNADVDPALDWDFRPMQRSVRLKVGEQGLAFFRATNLGDRPLTGSAVFNVTPLKAGPYFDKVACFCFDKQRLAPGETAEMPVTFFVDPEIVNDRDLDEVKTITLSYTFFRAVGEAEEERPQATGDARPTDAVARVN